MVESRNWPRSVISVSTLWFYIVLEPDDQKPYVFMYLVFKQDDQKPYALYAFDLSQKA